MAFKDIFKRSNLQTEVENNEERSLYNPYGWGGMFFNNQTSYSSLKAMQLSAINAGVNQISNSVALLKMNIVKVADGEPKVVKHNLTNILNMRPNSRYTHFNYMKMMIEDVILRGQAFSYIERDEQTLNVKALHYIRPDLVTPQIQADGSVKYIVSGLNKAVDAFNMIHLFMHCDENMNGIPVLKYAMMTLEGAFDAEQHSNNFFRSGGHLSGILKSASPLDNTKREQIRQVWNEAFRNRKDDISVALLPQGIEFQPISVDPHTAQLLESRKYGVIEIARFLNISPIKLFDLSEVSYSSMESTQLSYLQDTVLPYCQMMEDEFNLKLFKPSEVGNVVVDFDFTSLIQTNKKDEIDYYRGLITNGIMTVNEVRNKLGLASIENGDHNIMQMSYTTMDNIVSGVLIKGDTTATQSQSQQVDNKVKQTE